jgi:hypothetical protein
MKCKNGQIGTVGDSYANVNPQVWKWRKQEEEISYIMKQLAVSFKNFLSLSCRTYWRHNCSGGF